MHIETGHLRVVWLLIATVACSDGSDDDDRGIDSGLDLDARFDAGSVRDGARGDGGDAGKLLPDLTIEEQRAVCSDLVDMIREVTSDFAHAECAEAARDEPDCQAASAMCTADREAQYAEVWQQFDCVNEPERATKDCLITRYEFDACTAALVAVYDEQAQRVTCSSSEKSSPIPPPEPCAVLAGACDNLAHFAPQ